MAAGEWIGPAIGAGGVVMSAAIAAGAASRRRVLREVDRRLGVLEQTSTDTVEELAEIRGLLGGLLGDRLQRRPRRR